MATVLEKWSVNKVFLAKSSLLVMVLFIILAGTIQINKAEADKVKCSDFETQKQAQIAFDSNKSFYKKLDRDHDGIACEDNHIK